MLETLPDFRTLRHGLAAAGLLGLAACSGAASAPAPAQAPEAAKPDLKAVVAAADPNSCLGCHGNENPGIASHYVGSAHYENDVGCEDCHGAEKTDLDAFEHHGKTIATIVTPGDCGGCHAAETEEFQASHHAKGGNILHSLDNLLAESVEGYRGELEFPNPHNPGEMIKVNGMAFANSGCHQCHGSQVAMMTEDGGSVTPWSLRVPEGGGKAKVTFDATLVDASKIAREKDGRPVLSSKTWPNTGIGRLNLDGTRGSCSACHSRHDFSNRRARQPENCGKCHLGPDHPQKEIYEESKHGIAYRDLRDELNLDNDTWVLGEDYNAAPTCATCHMSAARGVPMTHDPRERISWNNRPPASLRIDTDDHGSIVKPGSDTKIVSTWEEKRATMQKVCGNCHTKSYVEQFYQQYDDFILLYNRKYAEPGLALMGALKKHGLLSQPNFDEKVEWTWFFVWHHEGRRGRHGVSMMAPDYSHWHGTYEVAERWYNEMIPEIREILEHAKHDKAKKAGALEVEKLLEEILARPEHVYPTTGKL